MDNQPIVGEHPRNCTNCAFAKHVQNEPPNIGSELKCCYLPPQLVLIPTPQGPRLVSMFPTVGANTICHQHALLEQIENAPRQLPNA